MFDTLQNISPIPLLPQQHHLSTLHKQVYPKVTTK
ncbi:hypothetical protein CIB84_012118 [Bambusicola thoracicus]|uniref:Uncharacterized protein n=1 Tax=Bambusicola thoracicus TaxID=9083 RepID=A0A2P4SJ42_BAMTH|nr:hypothetical protein CIB84_012118 [Bambusicola thoracicus]